MDTAGPATALILSAPTRPAQPCMRHVLTPGQWRDMAAALGADPTLRFQGLWAEADHVHALFLTQDGQPLLASVAVEAGLYAALSPHRPAAAWFERAVADLWGHQAAHAVDTGPLLDWGTWPVLKPLAPRPVPQAALPDQQEYPPIEHDDQHQATLGPCHGGSAGPVHLRLTCAGETVVRVDTRLGYGHRGIMALMRGKPARTAARLVARIAGGGTVAHSLAFARAVEVALGMAVPPRAHYLRAVMAELERLSNDLANAAAIHTAQGRARTGDTLWLQRETLLRSAHAAFGHRLMMDCVIPGGTATDVSEQGSATVMQAVEHIEAEWRTTKPGLLAPHAPTDPAIGVIDEASVLRYDAGGAIGKAAGIVHDARIAPGYPPYDAVAVGTATEVGSGLDARARIGIKEIRQSLRLLRTLVATLPAGDHAIPVMSQNGEGLAVVEAPGGACWCWVRVASGHVAAAWLRDPSWMHWPLLDHAVRGGPVSDFDMVHLSMGLSAAGVDQ